MMKHLGTGEQVDPSTLPQWKGKPKGKPPFERTSCGIIVQIKHCTTRKEGVECNGCKRTQAYREYCDLTLDQIADLLGEEAVGELNPETYE